LEICPKGELPQGIYHLCLNISYPTRERRRRRRRALSPKTI
jgi:hypothetical protein